MSPLPVIGGQFRIAMGFSSYGGITPTCVFHIGTATATVADIGIQLWDSFTEGQYGPMHEGFEPGYIEILPLDGTSATFVSPRPGGVTTSLCLSTGQILPAVSALLSLRTLVRGAQGRGRQYIGPVTETSMTDGNIEATVRGNLEDAWGDFIGNMGAQPSPMGLFVTSYVHEEAHLVNSYTVRQQAATQRRRQDQLVS